MEYTYLRHGDKTLEHILARKQPKVTREEKKGKMPPELLDFFSSCFPYLSRNPCSCQTANSIGFLVFSEFWCPLPHPVSLTGKLASPFSPPQCSAKECCPQFHIPSEDLHIVSIRKHGTPCKKSSLSFPFFCSYQRSTQHAY